MAIKLLKLIKPKICIELLWIYAQKIFELFHHPIRALLFRLLSDWELKLFKLDRLFAICSATEKLLHGLIMRLPDIS